MRVQYYIALRYLKGRNKFFFTFSNLLSCIGIFLSVFALLVVISVMNGFDRDIRERVVGAKAEIMVNKKDYSALENYEDINGKVIGISGVKSVSPVCRNELMIQRQELVSASLCYGIDLNRQKLVSHLLNNMRIGLPTAEELNEDGMIIGLDMAYQLNATVGDYVQVFSPVGTVPTPLGLLPKTKKLRVVGIFSTGMPEYDRTMTFMSLKNGQYFSGYSSDQVTHLEVKTADHNTSYKTASLINERLGSGFEAQDWSVFEANLFNSIKLEKAVMYLVLSLMIVLSAFNMSGNYIKMVAEKKQEIGVLKSIGAKDKDLIRILITIGMIVGITGMMTGLFSAWLFLKLQIKYHFVKIPVDVLPIEHLPVHMELPDFFLVIFLTMLLTFLTTIYPARKTMGISPVKILRD